MRFTFDLFDCFVEHNLDEYIDFFILILRKDDAFLAHSLFKPFSGFISFLVEQTQYKLEDGTVEDRLYKKIERSIDFFGNGPSRILKPFTTN